MGLDINHQSLVPLPVVPTFVKGPLPLHSQSVGKNDPGTRYGLPSVVI